VFRPCIDLHEGKVKQIVGGTLEADPGRLQTNFVSDRPAAWYAELYRQDGLKGGHIIMLGPGNEGEARAALQAYPGGLQIGGGLNLGNARAWLDAGASHAIVTSWSFAAGGWTGNAFRNSPGHRQGAARAGPKLPTARQRVFRVTDRWQKFTDLSISAEAWKNWRPGAPSFSFTRGRGRAVLRC